jgi:hypothetical protein
MANRDLKLNSLGRYGKNSARLILEEHSHCEVPAGCGGAVLRWRNPNTGLLFILQLFALGKCQLFIDGVKPASGRPVLSFGAHALSLEFNEVDSANGFLGFAAVHDESDLGYPRVSQASSPRIAIVSTGDGSWKYTADAPSGNAWMRLGFDDSSWHPLVEREPPPPDKKDMQSFRHAAILRAGAHCLGTVTPAARIWVRKEFSISRPAGA